MVTKNSESPELSVVIVSWNVSGFLNHCLDSVMRACTGIESEIIVVDNASTDNTSEMIREKYPDVRLIENAENRGYGVANNQGLDISRGNYVLFLNPDTILPRDALKLSIDYLTEHPKAGVMSLKLVDADGSFQAACRRGFPTPSAAFYRMTGLSALFPRSRRFGKYNLTYLDEDETVPVDAVCGAYMLGRADILKKIGGFDKDFFMYGEDIDLCWRVRKEGYDVVYHPVSDVIHFKGESSRKNRLKSAVSFYDSMFIFSKKYFAEKMSFMPRSLLFLGIFFNALVKAPAEWFLRYFAVPVDLFIVNAVLFMFLMYEFDLSFYTNTDPAWISYLIHICLSGAFGFSLFFHGAYSGKPKPISDYIRASAIATLLFFSLVYFIPYVQFPKKAFTATCALLMILIPGWRFIFSRAAFHLHSPLARRKRVVIVGSGELAKKVFDRLSDDVEYHHGFIGFIKTATDNIENLPGKIIGNITEINEIITSRKVTELVLATKEREQVDLVRLINYCGKKHVNMKIVESIPGQAHFYLLDVDLSENFIL
ncbi:MAG: glycosyltransferase [Fibrobacteres bacterium]|nr:glycosyltransferase [Fibrobacterota bacterium]